MCVHFFVFVSKCITVRASYVGGGGGGGGRGGGGVAECAFERIDLSV